MRWRYTRFDVEAKNREELLEQLRRLFHDLLLQSGGDVELAFDWMKQIDERYGIFQRGVSLAELREHLEARRTIATGPGGAALLTTTGEAQLRQESLDQVFAGLSLGPAGDHRVGRPGVGGERMGETRPWQFGDTFEAVDVPSSLRNALRRGGVELHEEDLEVYESEHAATCATVLLLDLSHSMILYGEDRITPAKRVAMALAELIRTRYPKDDLDVVTFGDEAVQVPIERLPYVTVGPFHTNTREALRRAQDILRRKKHPNRQILMITDGKPSALTERNGEIYKNPFGLDRRVIAKTLEEADRCRRAGIPITTFMLTEDPVLVKFVEEFTAINRGRAYFSGLGKLGDFLFVDYVRNRRRSVR